MLLPRMTRMARVRSTRRDARARALQLLLVAVSVACAKTNEQWSADLESPDPFVRGLAAIGMGLQSPREAGPAVPELLRMIDRADVGLEWEAARVLIHLGPFHVPALLDDLVLEELMSDDRRGAIKHALVAAGPVATGPIVRCMRGRGSHLVGDLGDVLLEIGAPSLPAIVEMLVEEEDVRLQNFAAFLLARMGPPAQSALPALRAATSSPDPGLRSMASEAIASIEGRSWRVPVPAHEGR